MDFQNEYCKLMAKPIDKISEDIFFRPDNFRGEPWYGDFQMYMAIGICQPAAEYTLQVRKALKVMGYATHTTIRDGKTYVLPGEIHRTEQALKQKRHNDRER